MNTVSFIGALGCFLMSKVSLEDQLNLIAKNIPQGYSIEIIVERDAAWVELFDINSNRITDHVDLCDMDLQSQLGALLEHAYLHLYTKIRNRRGAGVDKRNCLQNSTIEGSNPSPGSNIEEK